MKKTISLLLSLLLIFSLGATAFATQAEEQTDTSGNVTITKHPGGETVDVGGEALFIAHADNATAITWRIVSHDASNTVQASDAESYFAGVRVSGLGTDYLTLSNIPASMDGWYIEAKYDGPGGPVYSNGALLRVSGVAPRTPTISAQPSGASLESGKSTTLTVSAATTDGTLRFQWYSNTANSNQSGTAIDGATSSSYTPAEITGTTYYYVTVVSVNNGRESDAVRSNAVAVTYAEAAQATEQPAPTESAAPSTPAPLVPVIETPENGEQPEATQRPSEARDDSRSASAAADRASNALSMLTVVGGVLAVAAVAGGITALVLRRRGDDDDEDDE